jgi:hypothetical protein
MFFGFSKDDSLIYPTRGAGTFASVSAIIPRGAGVLRKVVAQPGEGPALFEAEAFHLITGSFGRHAEKVDFIQSGDEGSAVAPYRAVKVDRPQPL